MRPLALVVCLAAAVPALAQPAPSPGHVQIPVDIYNSLVTASDPSRRPRPVPAGFALGQAKVSVIVPASTGVAAATVRTELTIELFTEEWVLVPVLPAGTPVDSATVDGSPVPLASTPGGLAWATTDSGSHTMVLEYRVDAQRSGAGFVLGVPVPAASAIALVATLPGNHLDATVIPGAGARVTPAGASTRVEATVPTTSALQIAWRTPSMRGHALSRARYTGRLAGDAVTWTAEIGVDLFNDESATVPILPRQATLATLSVDGKEAPVLVEGQKFVTIVKGTGSHRVRVEFQTPVVRKDGPSRVDLALPPVPISRFDLSLPGAKELKVTPAASTDVKTQGGTTTATVHVPLTESVSFEWSEAVPGDVKAEARASAGLFHAVHAEEGVLYVTALVQYELSRGTVNRVRLLVPPGVQVNKIDSPSGAVADWRLAEAAPGAPRMATVFLDRDVEGELILRVHYDRSIGNAETLDVPLLQAPDARRQRGMVALLAGRDLTLDPASDAGGTRVGENQLPAFVREATDKAVVHTFKYADEALRLTVRPRTPDLVEAKFEAQVDTLVSLGEVAATGSSTVAVHVKSGRLSSLRLELPEGVNLLNVSAPSLRSHQAAVDDGVLAIDLSFTQEMEGDFRIDLAYERILADAKAEARVEIATPRVRGAEVEQGRIAVEALSAVEVKAAAAEHLTAVDVAELPQALVLRTTNPILMAYKYLHAEPAHRLALDLARHTLAEVQEAVIDRASYRTLFTRDGLQVTTAEFFVRNGRKQFLRLRLPKGASVWSASVDGKTDKPAVSKGKDGQENVLVKILSSTEGFPVQLVYASQGPALGGLGSARGALPRPDILVTESRWDVYVPAGMSYGAPRTNMELTVADAAVTGDAIAREMAGEEAPGAGSLRITVPASGRRFAFEKLYANQSGQDAWIALPYASAGGALLGRISSALGALLLWGGLAAYGRLHPRLPPLAPRVSLGIAACGLVLILVCVGLYHVGGGVAIGTSILALAAAGARGGVRWWIRRRQVPLPGGAA